MSERRRARVKASLNDVALRAGVSKGIASMALNGKGRMSEATRRRVQEAARDLNYFPSVRAQRLVSGDSKIVALASGLPSAVVANTDQYSSAINLAMRMAPLLLGRGYSVIMLPPMAGVDHLARLDLDGVVMNYPKEDDELVEELLSRQIPVVTVGKVESPAGVPYVDRGYAGADVVIEHLIERGASRILLISASEPYVMSKFARRYAAAVSDRATFLMAEAPAASSEGDVRSLVGRLIREGARFDAVYASIDVFAVGAMRALHDAGLAVPSEVMVATNFNGTRAQAASPPITSTTHNGAEHGLAEQVAALLLAQLTGANAESLTVESPSLMVRASTEGGIQPRHSQSAPD